MLLGLGEIPVPETDIVPDAVGPAVGCAASVPFAKGPREVDGIGLGSPVPDDTPVVRRGTEVEQSVPWHDDGVMEVVAVKDAGLKVLRKEAVTSKTEQTVLSQVIESTSALRFEGMNLSADVGVGTFFSRWSRLRA